MIKCIAKPVRAAIVIATLPIAALAERPADRLLVEPIINNYGQHIDIFPAVNFEKAILLVSGPDGDSFLEFEGRSPVSIEISDLAGEPLADGEYTWLLQLVPRSPDRTALQHEARLRDGRGTEASAWSPLFGSFSISDGLIDDPGLEETRAPGVGRSVAIEVENAGVEPSDRDLGAPKRKAEAMPLVWESHPVATDFDEAMAEVGIATAHVDLEDQTSAGLADGRPTPKNEGN